MSKALIKKSSGSTIDGAIPAVASAFIPGLGQLINGQSNKALGVFAVWGVCGLGLLGAIPLVGTVAGTIAAGTWVYGVADGYITGKKKG
jgi:TM2 domain-containing membrane protein YozV